MPTRNTNPKESRLLAVLPPDLRQRLTPHLELADTELRQVLYGDGEPIPHVYFPLACVASVVTTMANGDAIEVGTVGNEGFVGLPVLLGTPTAPHGTKAFIQVTGETFRMPTKAFYDFLEREPPFHGLLLRYANAFLLQVAQSAACNRLHTIDERCCRWLLMTHDRVGADSFQLTQDFLAQMLGVRRASVNAVATLLQKAGLIRYTRGRITVVDRKGLEAGACECYQSIRQEYERILGPVVRRS